jgi:hypothetical protein
MHTQQLEVIAARIQEAKQLVSVSPASSSGPAFLQRPVDSPLVANTDANVKLTASEAASLLNSTISAYAASGSSVEELYLERLREYEELSQKYDSNYKDTTEDAEMNGGVIEGGTWEHRKRAKEMLETAAKNLELTARSGASRHMGDYLPQQELQKFLQNAQTLAAGGTITKNDDYESARLTEQNIGYQMLQRAGWTTGSGLRSSGVVTPINMTGNGPNNAGVGLPNGQDLVAGDDGYDEYRKRMMLAYKYRPNPLNNPRRQY